MYRRSFHSFVSCFSRTAQRKRLYKYLMHDVHLVVLLVLDEDYGFADFNGL